MKSILRLAFCLILLSAAAAPWLRAQTLLSGPMVGHTTSTSARIWLETDQASLVRVHYWLEPRLQYQTSLGDPMVRGTAEAQTSRTAPHTGTVELTGLKPGWLVYYELEIDGKPVRPATPQVFSLLPEVNAERPLPNFAVAFASCMYPARVPVQPIWDQVALKRPDALLLIGDNNYMPNLTAAYETSEDVVVYAMARYHRYLRDLPGLRTVLATTPTYGIWDDHDFGPDNSDGTFRWKDLSLSLFNKYYANASAGLPEVPGIFTSFQIGDAQFFLLDDRYHRDPNQAADRKTMLGSGQLAWLKQAVQGSQATFKVIVNGGTLLVDRQGSGEYWANFGQERDEFLAWLSENRISGVLFAAGDWHVGTLNRLHREQDPYPFYELLSSNAGVSLPPPPSEETGQAHYRFHHQAGVEYRGFNFGLIRFFGPRGNRSVSLQIVDGQGHARVQLILRERDLTPDWRSPN
jgi:alkaline phosphatase D